MTKAVVTTFKFHKEIPEPKPEFWIGDEWRILNAELRRVCKELGWELDWRETGTEDLTVTS